MRSDNEHEIRVSGRITGQALDSRPMRLISVAVPVPFLDLLTYRVPDDMPVPTVGARVRVPVGSRTLTGCVIEGNVTAPDGMAVKDVAEVVDDEPMLTPAVVELCRWVAEYYMCGVGDAIAAAMPPGAHRRASSYKTRRVVSPTAHGLAVAALQLKPDEAVPDAVGPKQRAALQALAVAPAGLPSSDLRERGIAPAVVTRLVARGLATI